MKRENYLKPQTVREQVALEQGICSASIIDNGVKKVNMTSTAQGYEEVGASDAFEGKTTDGTFDITWK
jgi:hypothetical protein